MKESKGEMDWTKCLAGRLVIGIGCEFLLKGLFLKHNFSIREPFQGDKVSLLGSEENENSNPKRSISFSKLLKEKNLLKISENPRDFRPLKWARDWRNEIGHIPLDTVVVSGIEISALGLAILNLHFRLLHDEDNHHLETIKKILEKNP